MENFQERQKPRGDKWKDIRNIHREESECKMLQEKNLELLIPIEMGEIETGIQKRKKEFPH